MWNYRLPPLPVPVLHPLLSPYSVSAASEGRRKAGAGRCWGWRGFGVLVYERPQQVCACLGCHGVLEMRRVWTVQRVKTSPEGRTRMLGHQGPMIPPQVCRVHGHAKRTQNACGGYHQIIACVDAYTQHAVGGKHGWLEDDKTCGPNNTPRSIYVMKDVSQRKPRRCYGQCLKARDKEPTVRRRRCRSLSTCL